MQAIQNRSLLYESPDQKPLPATDVVPRGIYAAQLAEVHQFTNAWGERWAFVFRITDEAHQGEQVMLSTATRLTRQSRLGQTIEALLGRELTDAELLYQYQPKQLKGKPCQIVLGQAATKAGKTYTTVEHILT